MPRFEAFRGLRYRPDAAPLDDLIAPPYDVVDAEERSRLAARSPYNSIHVELPASDAARGLDRYQAAAALFAAWRAEGMLVRDPSPSFYVYRMGYVDSAGQPRATNGVIGALGLEPFGGAVVPHEQTMSAPGQDRLDLLRACQVNCSPIWGLSLAKGLTMACAAAAGAAVEHLSATDDEATTHEMWRIEDERAIRAITDLVAPAPVIIADGHHRHETASRYRTECRARNVTAPGGCDFIMAFVAELSPDQLALHAIHRLVSGLPDNLDPHDALAGHFRLVPGPDEPELLAAAMASRGAPALITATGTWLLLPSANVASGEIEPDSRRVDDALAGLPHHRISYQHGADRVIDAVRRGHAQAAVLLRPVTVDQLARTVRAGTRMPPKSTYFRPKPRTGFVFRSLSNCRGEERVVAPNDARSPRGDR
jgi:uncharacterized protein (DUF1015 family)